MFTHRIYGLFISSSRQIGLLPIVESPRIDFHVEWVISEPLGNAQGLNWVPVRTPLLDMLEDVFLWESPAESGTLTKAQIKTDGNRCISFTYDPKNALVKIYHQENESKSDLESYFVGLIMSFVLRLSGQVCLHSSAVAINGKAIAFIGYSTAGKSTTAAGMANAGARILTDDITAVVPFDNGFLVPPGYTRVRLRPKAAEFLTPDPDSLERVYSHRDSFYYSLENEECFETSAVPLAAIYLLGNVSDKDREPGIESVEPQERLIKLIENASGTYVVRGRRRAEEFKVLSAVAKTIPMRRLLYAHDIETLPRQCEIILDDFARLSNLAKA